MDADGISMKNTISQAAIRRERNRALLFYAIVPTWLVLYGIADVYAEFGDISWLTVFLIECVMIAIAAVLGWILSREGLLVLNLPSLRKAFPDEVDAGDSMLTLRYAGHQDEIVTQSRIQEVKPHPLLKDMGVWLLFYRSERGRLVIRRISQEVAQTIEAKRRIESMPSSRSEQQETA